MKGGSMRIIRDFNPDMDDDAVDNSLPTDVMNQHNIFADTMNSLRNKADEIKN